MFISMNWIRDHVDLSGLDIDRLIRQFSLSTAEVENEIFYKGKIFTALWWRRFNPWNPIPIPRSSTC